jgi:hypothetical protein
MAMNMPCPEARDTPGIGLIGGIIQLTRELRTQQGTQHQSCTKFKMNRMLLSRETQYLLSGLQRHQIHPVTNGSNEQTRKYPIFFLV